jgi:hypothetical protein
MIGRIVLRECSRNARAIYAVLTARDANNALRSIPDVKTNQQ